VPLPYSLIPCRASELRAILPCLNRLRNQRLAGEGEIPSMSKVDELLQFQGVSSLPSALAMVRNSFATAVAGNGISTSKGEHLANRPAPSLPLLDQVLHHFVGICVKLVQNSCEIWYRPFSEET